MAGQHLQGELQWGRARRLPAEERHRYRQVSPPSAVVPLPLICTLTFGTPLHLEPGEEKQPFLDRASAALLSLRGEGAA